MIINLTKGMLIGIANIIPGVSGGTFALVLGIYDRLIAALGGININLLKKIFTPADFINEFKKNDGLFLVELAVGAVISIAGLSWVVDYLLKNYPGMTLSFFMGLILPAISVPYGMIKERRIGNYIYVLPGILMVIFIYNMETTVINLSLPVVFLSGALAISAMILPGISGSFLLLVMGIYESVVGNIKNFTSSLNGESFVFLVAFGAGCIVGLVFFVKLMRLLFYKYKDKTLYFLIGLVLGSIVVLWPFKDYPAVSAGKIEIAVTTSANIMPESILTVFIYAVFFILGLFGAYGLNCIAKKTDK